MDERLPKHRRGAVRGAGEPPGRLAAAGGECMPSSEVLAVLGEDDKVQVDLGCGTGKLGLGPKVSGLLSCFLFLLCFLF